MKVAFLCHLLLGTHVQLFLTERREACFEQRYQQIWAEKFNPRDAWEVRRIAQACAFSKDRCPLLK